MRYFNAPAPARIVPFAIYIAFLPLGQVLANALPGTDLRWLYALQVSSVALAILLMWRQFSELHVPAALRGGDVALAVASGLSVFVIWIHLDQSWVTLGQADGFDPRDMDGKVDLSLAAVRIAGAAVVVPIMEELFWRSFLARWIDRAGFIGHAPQRLSFRAIAISSTLFAAEHTMWLAGLIAGLAYVGIYRRTGNLWVPVLSHAVTNAALGLWVLHTENWQFW